MAIKQIRNNILRLLQDKEYPEYISDILSFPLKKVIPSLLSALHNRNERIKWHAVAGFGDVIKVLSEADKEQGRIFIRRLLWMLSDESGGIAWGIPEVIGEVLSKVDFLAREYSSILIHQIIDVSGRPDNFLEYEPLRRGGYWAVARFSLSYPQIVKKYLHKILNSFDQEKDLFIILMGMFILKNLNATWNKAIEFINSKEKIEIFWEYKFQEVCVRDIACKILEITC